MPALISVCMTARESVIVALQTPPEGPQHSLLLSILGLILEVNSQVFLDFFLSYVPAPLRELSSGKQSCWLLKAVPEHISRVVSSPLSLWFIRAGGL